MSKNKNNANNSLKKDSFIQNFKKIHWGKLKGKNAEVFPLFTKVLFTTVVVSGILFGLNYLINYIWRLV
jgi:preprotein translocase subunit SecE